MTEQNPETVAAPWWRHALYVLVGVPLIVAWPAICVVVAAGVAAFFAVAAAYITGMSAIGLARRLLERTSDHGQ